MPEHSTITDPNIHEPKGISSAQESQVYVSDGNGSGTWSYPKSGWGFYKDGGSAQVFNTSVSKLLIDGAGSSNETSYLPLDIRGSSHLWDTSNNEITPIALGDAYELRLDLPVTSETGSPTEVVISLDIGGGASPTIVIVERVAKVGRTTPYTISVGFPIFCGSTFVANGGQLFLESDTGSVTVTNPGLFIQRLHGEY